MEANLKERLVLAPGRTGDGQDRCSNADGMVELGRILDRPENLEMHWSRLAWLIAAMSNAESCWILFSDDDAGDAGVRAFGNHGHVSSGTHRVASSDDSSFCEVLATANRLLHEPAGERGNTPVHRSGAAVDAGAFLVPICLEDVAVGVVHVRRGKNGLPLDERHLDTVRLVAFLIGKSLHVARMQKVLNSRFAQLALMQCSAAGRKEAVQEVIKHPKGIGRLVAKSFYREMTKAGLDSNEIIAIASEIISQLSASLKARQTSNASEVP